MHQIPLIFLAGPPGSGKTTLGHQVCEELGLRFLDLSKPTTLSVARGLEPERKVLETAITNRPADVVALSWPLQQDKAVRVLARRSGFLLLLWAHPLDMQARSGHSEPLFTPVKRLGTKGGFGRNGTGCPEFRRLDRTSNGTLMLVNAFFAEAAEALKSSIGSIREESSEPSAVREGLNGWLNYWQKHLGANKQAAEIIVDAMARYTLHLKSQGASVRKLSSVYDDLEMAGMLVIMYDAPKKNDAQKVLENFYFSPWEIEFGRRFSDSPTAMTRYERTLNGFSKFLQESGLLGKTDE